MSLSLLLIVFYNLILPSGSSGEQKRLSPERIRSMTEPSPPPENQEFDMSTPIIVELSKSSSNKRKRATTCHVQNFDEKSPYITDHFPQPLKNFGLDLQSFYNYLNHPEMVKNYQYYFYKCHSYTSSES